MSKILVINSSEISAKQLSKQLTSQYFDVITTLDPKEAIELISREFFKVIIIDIIMPNADCYELCAKIKKAAPLLPIFTISPFYDPEARIKSLAVGAEDLIVTPFDLELFVTRIRMAIKVKDDLDQLISRNKNVDLQSITSTTFNMNTANIILIDDDIAEVNYLNDLLIPESLSLHATENISDLSEEIIKKADLIIASGYLIDSFGVEICTKIKNNPSLADKPIVLIVEQDDEELLKEAFKAGINEYATSPINGEEFMLKIRKLLNRVSLKKKLEGRLLKDLDLAIEDPLTGLYNRRYFDTKTTNLIQNSIKNSKQLSLTIADIDKFKLVNDTYGHLVGDEVLVETAKRMQKLVGNQGVVFRFGGEEFIILLENTDLVTATQIAEQIRNNCSTQKFNISVAPHLITCTLSFGVTTLNLNDKDMDDLIKRADDNLYKAKDSGRNKVISTA